MRVAEGQYRVSEASNYTMSYSIYVVPVCCNICTVCVCTYMESCECVCVCVCVLRTWSLVIPMYRVMILADFSGLADINFNL